MTVLWTIAWPLLLLSAVPIWFWVAVRIRIGRWLRGDSGVRRGVDLPPPGGRWPRVSIVVPVHDEERVIEACIESLCAQAYDDLEIIVVLDRCSDASADLLAPWAEADDRVVVLRNERSPTGWTGKCNAARIGAARATGRWLLFADADTTFDPDLVRSAVAIAIERDVGLLSLLSTLSLDRGYERIAQPVATMNLMWLFPAHRVDRGNRSRPFANGQFLLFRRDWYTRAGGHEAVRGELLEDIALARRVYNHGGRTMVMLGDGMLRCSMYESMADFRRGWKRIFVEACKRKPARLRQYALRTLGVGVGLPAVQIATLATSVGLVLDGDPPLAITLGLVVLAGVAAQISALKRVYALAEAPRSLITSFPLGSWIIGRVMLEGLSDLNARREVTWGGRVYALEPR